MAADRGIKTQSVMINYIIFGISISIISWMVGIILNGILVKTKYYDKLSNLNFITSARLNRIIGIKYFKWIVVNTFFKFFNQSIKLEGRKKELADIRRQMTLAEISHLIGFFLFYFLPFIRVLPITSRSGL